MNKKFSSLLLLSTVCFTLGAQAGTEDYKSTREKQVIQPRQRESLFYISAGAGGEFDIHATKFISNGGGDLGIPGAFALPTKVQSRDFSSTHDVGVINGQFEVGYHVQPWLALFVGFTYSHSDGDDSRRLGRFSDPSGAFGPTNGVYDLYASVSEYEAYTGRGGFKLTLPRTLLDFIHAPKAITPYISASAGGKYVEASHIRLYGAGIVDTGRYGLYDGSWVFTTQINFGYEYSFTPRFSAVLESGYGYDTKPERSDDRIPGLSGVNDGGDRLYSTVSLSAKLKF